jgi:hypothetical protein
MVDLQPYYPCLFNQSIKIFRWGRGSVGVCGEESREREGLEDVLIFSLHLTSNRLLIVPIIYKFDFSPLKNLNIINIPTTKILLRIKNGGLLPLNFFIFFLEETLNCCHSEKLLTQSSKV